MPNLIEENKKIISEAVRKSPQEIDVASITPEEKDHERAQGLRWKGSTFKGNNDPWPHKAKAMAGLIQDPEKLVRRAKAVHAEYGDPRTKDNYSGYYEPGGKAEEMNVFEPFRKALEDMGFTHDQIETIKKTSKPN